MSARSSRRLGSPATKLAAYGVALVALLAGGIAVGASVGPDSSAEPAHEEGAEDPAAPAAPEPPAGLSATQDGYHLQLDTPSITAEAASTLRFVIRAPDGQPLAAYDVEHEKELHLIVVSRDLRSYAHLHPSRAADGTWSVTAPPLPAGPYRLYADFVPTGHEGVTLATDLGVSGAYTARTVPTPADTASVDDYEVTIDGELVAGEESEVTVTVTRNGEPVRDLQPYLGALGHLVAIRDGDLAYLHVHPLDELDGPGGPAVRFAVAVPSAGTYGLFFDFSHDDTVRTGAVTRVASGTEAPADEPADEPSEPSTGDDGHDTHG